MKAVYIILALLVLGAGAFLLLNRQQQPSSTPTPTPTVSKQADNQTSFQGPKKSAHYETNTPAHGTTLAGVPINVVIDFNFDLGKGSKIEIHGLFSREQIGVNEYGVGETIIDENKLSMRRKMDPSAPDGKYSVAYTACWPDGSCHDGYFQFAIDRSLAQGFDDQTSKKEVEVKMSQIAFQPQNIKVSKGTKITWVNDDSIEHYVNTDSHPAHTYYKDQNSKALKKGERYSVVFSESGIYPYHCSAHAAQMTGNILVE